MTANLKSFSGIKFLKNGPIWQEIKIGLRNAKSVKIISPFITSYFLEEFEKIVLSRTDSFTIQLLTTTYDGWANFLDVKSLEKTFLRIQNQAPHVKIEIRIEKIALDQNDQGKHRNARLHSKGFIFEGFDDFHEVILGSSNLTKNGLETGREWNLKINSQESPEAFQNILKEFNNAWNEKPYFGTEHLPYLVTLAKEVQKLEKEKNEFLNKLNKEYLNLLATSQTLKNCPPLVAANDNLNDNDYLNADAFFDFEFYKNNYEAAKKLTDIYIVSPSKKPKNYLGFNDKGDFPVLWVMHSFMFLNYRPLLKQFLKIIKSKNLTPDNLVNRLFIGSFYGKMRHEKSQQFLLTSNWVEPLGTKPVDYLFKQDKLLNEVGCFLLYRLKTETNWVDKQDLIGVVFSSHQVNILCGEWDYEQKLSGIAVVQPHRITNNFLNQGRKVFVVKGWPMKAKKSTIYNHETGLLQLLIDDQTLNQIQNENLEIAGFNCYGDDDIKRRYFIFIGFGTIQKCLLVNPTSKVKKWYLEIYFPHQNE